MIIIENTTEFHIEEPTAVAIGKFDGFHRGHKAVFDELMAGKKKGLKTVVFTFNPSPSTYFSGTVQPELATVTEKRRFMERLGVDYYVEYPFYDKTAAVEPEEYVKSFLLDKLHMKLLVAGEDVSFGAKGRGNKELLMSMSKRPGFSLRIIPKLTWNGIEISSTLVRDLVAQGDMEACAQLLGRPYSLFGNVGEGKKLGRTLDMPTANLYPEDDKFLPPFGVYYGKAVLRDSKDGSGQRTFDAVINIGIRPTVNDGERVSAEA
ncbi:MAG: bifunctional riboflavin kinase/FMN adenylyltransferase, partial [Lachnospiraceae bacterium]|nr:bifunctional riboflavin kinase/FMN adenylyltransferase [Lachnospiraceae bacterium]